MRIKPRLLIYLMVLSIISCAPVKNNPATIITPSPSITTETHTRFPTRTPISAPYQKPIPVSPEQISQAYLNITQNNTCELPCFLGIAPGKTLWNDTKNIFSPYTASTRLGFEGKYGQYTAIVLDEENNGLEIRFRIDREPSTVIFMEMSNETPVQALLSTLKLPNQVLINSAGMSGMGKYFTLVVAYFKQGVIAILDGEFQVVAEKATICSEQIQNIQMIVLWSPEDIRFIGDLIRLDGFSGIESISDTTVEEFYDHYSKENTNYCFTLDY